MSKRSDTKSPADVSGKGSAIWRSILASLLSVIVFFGLLEGSLLLFGIEPALQNEDPFVGFSSSIPLFVEETEPEGRKIMTTGGNKLIYFNRQQFPKDKAPGTYRVFCLGGSTTYGRPYNDMTSFAGWLRELLPAADDRHKWEVINAGGISYASYRVARLMKELSRYEPDLFIVYSGHNEFLEERTYGKLRDIPGPVKEAASLLAGTRTWAAMSTALEHAGLLHEVKKEERVKLSGEVNTILARSAGPERYSRDDKLRDQVLLHYRISIERMADIARSAGADIIFVTPASNIKDSSPFKSQHTAGLSGEDRLKSEEMLSAALELIREKSWPEALSVLDEALSLDPRYAELHYRRGKALFALGRDNEAAYAFRRARDEDVCPLRAVTPMLNVLAEAAEKKNAVLVDFIALIEHQLLSEHGHNIPGREYFLDHVHPTIEGNKMLALQLIETMADKDIVRPSGTWGDKVIAEVSARIENSLDRKEHARALVNLARVMNWAGKDEDAGRLAAKVLSSEGAASEAVTAASTILATQYQKKGDAEQALRYFRRALHAAPGSPQIHLQIGLTFLNEPLRDFEEAAAHLLFATVFWPESDMAYMTLGLAMAERKRYPIAYSSLMEAVRIYPQNTEARSALQRLKQMPDPGMLVHHPPKVTLEKYPSGALSRIVQVRPDSTGRYIPEGIWTEWYENGELKRFVDYVEGVPHGTAITWGPDGKITSHLKYRMGKQITRPAAENR